MNSIHNTMPVDAAHAASDVDTMESDNAHPNTTSSTEGPAAGKRKASTVSPFCKCGSSDHKRTNHKLRPLNKKKKVDETVGSIVSDAVRDVSEIPVLNALQKDSDNAHPNTTSSTEGPAAGKRKASTVSPFCKCGSSDHKRTNHKLRPLNKKKKVVETVGSNVPDAVRDVSEIPVLNALQKDVDASKVAQQEITDSNTDAETKKPCKCGSTEHQKISHKSCPLYRGAIKERFKAGDEEESFCTVKMGLNQFLACSLEDNEKQALTDVVNDAESFCTVKMGLNQFFACSLEDNEKQALTDVVNDAVQRLTDLNGIMCQVFQAVQQKSLKAPYTFKSQKNELLNTYMNDVYSKIRDPKMAYCDASGLSSIVNSIAKKYATNALNHVQINVVRFTRQYVDFILSREVGSELTRKNYNQVKQFILAELERNSSDSNLKRFPFEALMVIKKKKLVKRPQSEHDALFATIIKIWDTARDVLQCRNLTKSMVPSRRFGYHITTDGVQVGISVLKPLSEAKVNEWGLDDEEVFHPLPMNSETRIVAIDPDSREVMKSWFTEKKPLDVTEQRSYEDEIAEEIKKSRKRGRALRLYSL
ncbi:hypothetical protein MP638_006737, partial [Amoeboaphelidium occidentale]